MAETLLHGDCLKLMQSIEDKSIDLILADLPYGTTNNKWDSVIPLDKSFQQYKRIIKDHGAILLFGQGAFGASLINSAPKSMPFRYEWIWEKTSAQGFLNAHKMPMRAHENIYVFYKHLPKYNPQMTTGHTPYKKKQGKNGGRNYNLKPGSVDPARQSHGTRYPRDVIKFSNGNYGSLHPTQKPVPLLEYLIKTYTDKGDMVLDNTMGSGSTGVACKELGRNFVGMELTDKYFEIAKNRINNTSLSLFDSENV